MIRAFLLLIVLILPLVACGGGGGGSTPTLVEPQTPVPMPPEPPPIEPPPTEPPPVEPTPLLEDMFIFVSYPRDGRVTFENETEVRGTVYFRDRPDDLRLADYSLIVESNGEEFVGSFEEPGFWALDRVALSADVAPELNVFVRGPNGGETERERVVLSRTTDNSDPVKLAAGFNAGEFLTLFPGNELRTYDAAGNELNRVPLPAYDDELHASLAVWPHTGEVIQSVETEPGQCSLVAHSVNQPLPLRSRILTTISKPADQNTSCSYLMSAVARAETLFVNDITGNRLLGLDSDGNGVSDVALEREVPYLIVNDPASNDLFVLRFISGSPQANAPSARLEVSRLDPVTGAESTVMQTPIRTSRTSFFSSAVMLPSGLYYSWGGVFYRVNLDSESEEAITYTGFTVVGPRESVRVAAQDAACQYCFYVLDSTGRVARIDTATLASTFVVDTSPRITPWAGFSDMQFDGGERLIWEQHSEVSVGFDLTTVSWRNLYIWDATTFAVHPVQVSPDSANAGYFGQPVSPRRMLVTRFDEANQREIAFYDTRTQEETLFDIDYSDLGGYVSARFVGLRGEYVTIQTPDGLFDYSLEPAQRIRRLLFDTAAEPLDLVQTLVRFPGPDGAVYAYHYDRPSTLFRVDFDTGTLIEVSGPMVGSGPPLPESFDRVQHWSLETNEAFLVAEGLWFRIDLGTGDRTLLFNGETPEGLPDDFLATDLYYLAASNSLVASSLAGIFEIDLEAGIASPRSLEWNNLDQ